MLATPKHNGQCRFCDSLGELVRSHIIPYSFFQPLREGDVHPIIYGSKRDWRITKRPSGIWDRFLCDTCENRFNRWDDYGYKVLVGHYPHIRYGKHQNERCILFQKIDYARMKLFALGLLWRAISTNRFEFSTISSSIVDEVLLKQHLENDDPGPPGQFGVWAYKFDEYRASQIMLPPFFQQVGGENFAAFWLGGYVLHVQITTGPTPSQLDQLILAPNRRLAVPIRKFTGSYLHRHVTQIARDGPPDS